MYLVSILVSLALGCEGIPLLVVQILLQVEERVEEDGRHLAHLQVLQRDHVRQPRADHVQHLNKEELLDIPNIIFLYLRKS